MRWQPANALTGPAQKTATGDRLALDQSIERIEMVWGDVPLGAEFACAFDFKLTSPATAPCIAWQLHDGANVGGLNPIAALEFTGQDARIVYRHHVSSPVVKADTVFASAPVGGISANWSIQGRHDLSAGRLLVRRNGVLLLDYEGPLGFNLPQPAYQKRGLYSWVARSAPIVAEISV